MLEILENGEGKFANVEKEDQAKILLDVISNLYGKKQTIDLEKIGGSKHAGICLFNRNISKCSEAIICFKSVTGISKREVNLLKI